jgi:hypothetical protein
MLSTSAPRRAGKSSFILGTWVYSLHLQFRNNLASSLISIVIFFGLLYVQWVEVRVRVRGGILVFDTTFNNISVISWRSLLLMEEDGVPGENHQPVASHWGGVQCNNSSNIKKTKHHLSPKWANHDRDHMVVVSLNPTYDEVYSIHHNLVKFLSDLRQVGGFLLVLRLPPSIKVTAMI